MAVMYSKLGGCLGVTDIVGSFSQNRPLSWCQGFAGEVNDPIRVGIFIGRSLGGLVGGVVVVLSSLGDSAVLLGSLGCPVPVRMPETLPDWPILIIRLTCLGGLSPSLEGGRAVVELLPSLGGRIAIAWEGPLAMGEMLPSLGGRWAVAGRELLPSLEGRWVIAGVRLLPSLGGGRAIAGRELLPSWEGRWAIAGVRLLPSPGEVGEQLPGESCYSFLGRKVSNCLGIAIFLRRKMSNGLRGGN